jgi:hypothetical protein
MDNISSQIGALELGDHLESYSDGALENAAHAVDPFTSHCNQTVMRPMCVSDSVLEAAGANVAGPPITPRCGTLQRCQ